MSGKMSVLHCVINTKKVSPGRLYGRQVSGEATLHNREFGTYFELTSVNFSSYHFFIINLAVKNLALHPSR